ncbi:DMT family transporter [Intestinibacter bartlettii]|uniref:DMT family transporter n=1 Tax=Intestinibacter bartlettii TaxID=261299 RepID=UPI002FE6F364
MFNLKRGYLYIALSTFFFSTMEISLKLVAGDFNSIQMTVSRFFVGSLVLLPFAIKHLKALEIHLEKEDLFQFAWLGFICIVISMILYQLAVMHTKASVVASIFSCNPIFVLVFAHLLLKSHIYKHNIIALILQVIGILCIINPFATKLSISGIIFTILAALTFALYGVCGKKSTEKFGGTIVTCFSFIFGSLELLVLTLFSHISPVANFLISHNLNIFANVPLFTGYTLSSIPVFIYIAVGVTGMGYCFYFLAMEYTDANTTSLIFFFKPIMAPILAFIILKEFIPLNMIFGILFILCGSIYTIVYTMRLEEKLEIV